jgi:hypothetical protein
MPCAETAKELEMFDFNFFQEAQLHPQQYDVVRASEVYSISDAKTQSQFCVNPGPAAFLLSQIRPVSRRTYHSTE